MEPPSRGAGTGLVETIKNYAYDGGILLGLMIALLAFLGAAWHSLTVYADVQNQRKPWKDLGAVVGVGALLAVVIICFLTKAADERTEPPVGGRLPELSARAAQP